MTREDMERILEAAFNKVFPDRQWSKYIPKDGD